MNGKKTFELPEDQSAQSLIAEAIRAKREQSSLLPVDDDEWEKLEARVLADIEKFSTVDDKFILNTDKAPPKQASVATLKLFSSVDENADQNKKPSSANPGTPDPRPTIDTPVQTAESIRQMGLLAELHDLSSRHESEEYQREHHHQEVLHRMDEVMRLIFLYMHELIKQLNRIHIPIPRDYPILSTVNCTNLAWREGFVDYRTLSIDGKAHPNQVNMNYMLDAPEQFSVEREGESAEKLRQLLIDCNIHFEYIETKNDRFKIEKGVFNFPSEIRVNLRFEANYDREVITIHTKNLTRIGVIEYELPAALINNATLDELGKVVLARPNNWRSIVRP